MDEPLGFELYSGTTAGGTGTAHEVFADRLGSVIKVVEAATGAVVSDQRFDSFGLRTATGPLLQRYGFTGREHDAESGLIYYRARAYDPEIGQFLQRDPIGFAAGDLNLYAYTWNDPYNWKDPSGLAVSTDFAVLSAGLVGLGTACYATGACQNAGKAAGGIGGLIGGVLNMFTDMWNRLFSQGNDSSGSGGSGGGAGGDSGASSGPRTGAGKSDQHGNEERAKIVDRQREALEAKLRELMASQAKGRKNAIVKLRTAIAKARAQAARLRRGTNDSQNPKGNDRGPRRR